MTGAAPVRTVAVLGTGHMGSAMSRALAEADFDLVLFNRTLVACRRSPMSSEPAWPTRPPRRSRPRTWR